MKLSNKLPALTLIALFALLGCVAEPPEYYGPYKLEKMSTAERADCLRQGGQLYVGGIFPTELCDLPTPDAGKACSRASDCQGYCRSATRTCSQYFMGSGAYDLLDEDGSATTIFYD
ncbi:hypothetical protein [Paragemmobacter ruber]|nr:hypothetical protein [Rhodobacter ruber]